MVDIEKYFFGFMRMPKAPNLKTMKFFMNEYGWFEKQMKFIHVAGTNGKGSCVELISSVLKHAGYKVGKFISPHLMRYNERISINEVEISDEDFSALIEEIRSKINFYGSNYENKVTLFEAETIIALLYFYRNKVDFAVLETGLGGLYDCTNIISKPLVSVITSIGYDHTNILGNTLPQIAEQKAGIIKKDSCTVFFEQEREVNLVISEVCKKQENNLHKLNESFISNYKFDGENQYFDYGVLKKIKVSLKGKSQIKNTCLCIETVKILNGLGYKISERDVRTGIENVVHKGRMEIINQQPLIVYDGAHNPPAIKNLLETINMYHEGKKKVYVIAILKRKDYETMLKLLIDVPDNFKDTFVFTSGNNSGEYMSADELFDVAKKYSVAGQKLYKKSLDDALEFILHQKEQAINFVIGSFYIYGDVKKKLCNSFNQ